MKILVAYDGSINSKLALKYGIRKISEIGGSLAALHVFNSSMFIDYGSGPNAEALARKESSGYIEEARGIIAEHGAGEYAKLFTAEGNPEEETIRFARTEMMDLIIVPPRYKSVVKKAPCSVSIMPGNILLPVDNTDSCLTILEKVAREAAETASKVIVLGIVPIHLYSRGEKKEIERIRKETETAVKKVKKLLVNSGIETKDIIRSGYPDVEIVKVADEYPVTMIMVSENGDTPSELGKAANIIIDDSENLKKPVLFVAPENTV
ncbi:MAG: universal stress protein [Thermodesulfovibrionales bacterium]